MSRTLSPIRAGVDFYPTPAWATRVILPHLERAVPKPIECVLEPAAGDGAIVQELVEFYPSVVDCYEIREECQAQIQAIEGRRGRVSIVAVRDFLAHDPERRTCDYDLVMTNPPYNAAFDFLLHALKFVHVDGSVALLLRLGWLEAGGSAKTAAKALWLRDHVPDVYLLQRRPSFIKTASGGNDSATYAWMVWRPYRKQHGKLVLVTRDECRQAEKSWVEEDDDVAQA